MEIQKDFKEFFALFNAHKVEYVIVGGYALAFHGAPRYTGDIGVLVRADILDLDYGGVLVKVVGREALLINKRATGRTQDLADIEALEDQPD
jgi:hypothetical protein